MSKRRRKQEAREERQIEQEEKEERERRRAREKIKYWKGRKRIIIIIRRSRRRRKRRRRQKQQEKVRRSQEICIWRKFSGKKDQKNAESWPSLVSLQQTNSQNKETKTKPKREGLGEVGPSGSSSPWTFQNPNQNQTPHQKHKNKPKEGLGNVRCFSSSCYTHILSVLQTHLFRFLFFFSFLLSSLGGVNEKGRCKKGSCKATKKEEQRKLNAKKERLRKEEINKDERRRNKKKYQKARKRRRKKKNNNERKTIRWRKTQTNKGRSFKTKKRWSNGREGLWGEKKDKIPLELQEYAFLGHLWTTLNPNQQNYKAGSWKERSQKKGERKEKRK